MPPISVIVAYAVSTLITFASAGCGFSSCCLDSDRGTNRPPTQWLRCKNRPENPTKDLPDPSKWVPPGGWACADPAIDFPTVDCLAQDMQACGTVTQDFVDSIFYSFGATTDTTTPFRDQLNANQPNPKGVMFNDALDGAYFENVIDAPRFSLDSGQGGGQIVNGPNTGMTRFNLFVARASEAFARVSTGTVYVVLLNNNGDAKYNADGQPGIFQNSLPPTRATRNPNQAVFKLFELPTLQRNQQVTKIISVDQGNQEMPPFPYTQRVDWDTSRNDNHPLLPASFTMDIEPPPPGPFMSGRGPQATGAAKYKYRRDDLNLCGGNTTYTWSVSSSSSSTGTAPATTSGPPSAVSCEHQDQTPQVETEFCICQGSITLPVLSAPSTALNDPSSSCAYTIVPTSTAMATPTTTGALGPPVTDTTICQVCTPYAANQDNCNSLPNCTPSPTATSNPVKIQAGSSGVHVGFLTSSALYTSISSAINQICPTATPGVPTFCTTDSVTIKDISFIDQDTQSESGEIVLTVESSNYTQTSLRDAIIQAAAMSAQMSATGSNCKDTTYTSTTGGPLRKRSWWQRALPPSIADKVPPNGRFDLLRRTPPMGTISEQHVTYCESVNFAGVDYYGPNWQQEPGPSDWIYPSWSFKIAPGGDFKCDFIQDLIDELSVLTPEFAVGEVELGEAFGVACRAALGAEGGE